MFRKAVMLAVAVAGAGWSFAQQTQDIDPDLLAYFAEIEADTGVKRFGPTHLGELEGGDSAKIDVAVDPDTYTFLAVICGPSCLEITATVRDSTGKEIVPAPAANVEAVIQIPPGNGGQVSVNVDMVTCDWDSCPYAIQTFTRPAS
jgi:hypothetical protein